MKNLYRFLGTAVALLTATSAYSQYCTPLYTTACSVGDQIENFSTTGGSTNITNNSTGCTTGGYIYYSAMTVSSVPTGTINFSVQSGSQWAQQFAIFVDWNNDQDLVDAGEMVWATTTSSTSAFTGSFTIPASAVTGTNLRMRVRCQYSSPVADPCISYTFGEAEDYNLFVAGSASNDAGISAIVEPDAGCVGTRDVKVQVENFGINAIDSVLIHWSINNSFQGAVLYNQTLDTAGGAGQSVDTVTLGSITFLNSGSYTIRAWTLYPNNLLDTANYNDTSAASYTGTNFPTMSLGSDTFICPGEQITLTASSTNPDSALWSDNTKGNVRSVSTAGTYIVSAFKNGCESEDSINVSLHPNPPVVNLGNDTTFCFGDIITLDATAIGVTYLWQDNSTNAMFPADTSGIHWVVIEDVNSCTSTDTIELKLYKDASVTAFVSPSTTLCYGVPYIFSANAKTSGSQMFQLVINGVNSGAPQMSNIFNNPVLEYADTVRIDLLTDQCAVSAYPVPSNELIMFINPEPVLINGLASDIVVENTKKSYAVANNSSSGYLWSASGGTIVGDSTSFAVQVQWNGANPNASLTLTERDQGNCSYDNVLPVNIISIDNVAEYNTSYLGDAYPNPADQSVIIPVTSSKEVTIQLSLYDMTGKEVQNIYSGNLLGSKSFSINVKNLDEGLYFYKIQSQDRNVQVKKLIIQH